MKRISERVKRAFINLPIVMKILVVNSVLVLVSLILLGYIVNRKSTEVILDGSVTQNTTYITLLRQGLDNSFQDVENLSNAIIVDNELQNNLLNYNSFDENDSFVALKDTSFYLDDMANQMQFIDSVMVYTSNEIAIISRGDVVMEEILAQTRMNVDKLYNVTGNWSAVFLIDEFTMQVTSVVTYSKNIYHGKSGKYLGSLVLTIKEEVLAENYVSGVSGDHATFSIVDESRTTVSSANKSELGQKIERKVFFSEFIEAQEGDYKIRTISNEDYLITSGKIPSNGWYIVGRLPIKTLMADSSSVTRSIISTVALFYVIMILVTIFFVKIITRPIIKLTEVVTNLNEREPIFDYIYESEDEIGKLTKSFKDLSVRTNDLVEQIYLEQKSKRINEFLALQAQINPHFLYNTLESACSLIRMDEDDEAFKVIKSLGVFYRTSLSKGKNVITLEEEIQNVSSYLVIQKIRYGDKLNYKIDVPKELFDQLVIKLTLQPLIENAIYHGIRKRKGKGLIEVIGKLQGDALIIEVIDDGVGMDKTTLRKLLETKDSIEWKNSYGLRSVHERIQLYFGEDFGINVESEINKGTKVQMSVPYNKKTGGNGHV